MRKVSFVFIAGLVATLLASGAFGPLAPVANATLPPGGGCPAAAGGGTAKFTLSATLPASAPANGNGVCITLSGSSGQNQNAVLVANAPGCVGVAVPSVGAGGDKVWADWGTNNCVVPGQTVTIKFQSSAAVLTVTSVVWNCQGDTTTSRTGTVFGPIGGIAEVAGAETSALGATDSGGSSGTTYAVIAVVAGVALLGAGGWYARRRWLS